jgi:phospholipid/cholesterol/gamma-HCH transport system permease protein
MLAAAEHIGRAVTRRFDQIGFSAALVVESFYWLIFGRRERQKVRVSTIFEQMEHIGLEALPIVTLLSATIGVMLAIQGTYSLGLFGAESFVYFGVALAVTREFAPLITGILIAGRSGSALAARLSTMAINQEIDALRAIGISPTRYLVVPALIGMLVILPALTIWSGIVGIGAAGLFVSTTLDITMAAFVSDVISVLTPGDVLHGLIKAVIFAFLIVMVGVVNGVQVEGGAAGVGKVTTRSVVQSISCIIVFDMIIGLLFTPT